MSGPTMWLEAPLEKLQYLQVSCTPPCVAKLGNSLLFLRRLLGLSDNTMLIQHSLKGQACMEVFCLQFSLHCVWGLSPSCPH